MRRNQGQHRRGDRPNGRFGDTCNKTCMLLLNLTLCCFQMRIPHNETQTCSQNDLYVLEAIGGLEAWLTNPSGTPQGSEGNGVFYQEASKGRGQGSKNNPTEFKVMKLLGWERLSPTHIQPTWGVCPVADTATPVRSMREKLSTDSHSEISSVPATALGCKSLSFPSFNGETEA